VAAFSHITFDFHQHFVSIYYSNRGNGPP
jgi:hypothetical protein